ncbi:MAG: hypothetical protein SW833_03605 [Cyanobacteriota bacterium]|nr:hypothetical protein [Cyanobacteriota bacterium]
MTIYLGKQSDNLRDIDIQKLRLNWNRLFEQFPSPKEVVDDYFQDLVRRYSTRDRVYHTLAHIRDVLATLEILEKETNNIVTLRFAAWFHDVIYDTRANDNEEKSAEFAELTLNKLQLSPQTTQIVKSLILQTQKHQPIDGDSDSRIFLDADLAILGTRDREYDEYAKAIRKEYDWVEQNEYMLGRKRVLESFLQRSRIYFTPRMYNALEKRARSNLTREIEVLSH